MPERDQVGWRRYRAQGESDLDGSGGHQRLSRSVRAHGTQAAGRSRRL